jgi:hypothetical protein
VTTHAVLAIRNPAGVWIDAAAFSNGTTSTVTFQSSLSFIQGLGLWLPANCGGVACDNNSNPTAQGISAAWASLTTDVATSIRRTGVAKDASAWAVGASSFGGTN